MIEKNSIRFNNSEAASKYLFNTFKYLLILSSIMQLLIDSDSKNIYSIIIIAISSLLTISYLYKNKIFYSHPLIALSILAFNFSTQSGALIVQSFTFTNLIEFLESPIESFFFSSLFEFSLLFSLHLFKNNFLFNVWQEKIRLKYLYKTKLMIPPSINQLWIMGFIGIISLYLQLRYVGSTSEGIAFGDVGGKFLQGLIFFVNAPFLLLIYNKIYLTKKASRNNFIYILFYLLLLLIIAVAVNARYFLIVGVTNVALMFFVYLLSGQITLQKKSVFNLSFIFIIFLLIFPIISDLSTSMVVARNDRGTANASEMIEQTLYIFNNNEVLNDYRENELELSKLGGTELYIKNPLLNRFISTKYLDRTISYVDAYISQGNNSFISITTDKILSFLPSPILKMLGVDKNDIFEYSFGDRFYFLESGMLITGMKTGSNVAHAMALFGKFLFPIFLIPFFLLIFFAISVFESANKVRYLLCPAIILQLYPIYTLFISDSLADAFVLILRLIPQTLLFYWIVLKLTKNI